MKKTVSRRDAFRALAAVSPVLAVVPAQAQATNDSELAAAEQRLNASIQELHQFPLPADAEPAVIFKA